MSRYLVTGKNLLVERLGGCSIDRVGRSFNALNEEVIAAGLLVVGLFDWFRASFVGTRRDGSVQSMLGGLFAANDLVCLLVRRGSHGDGWMRER